MDANLPPPMPLPGSTYCQGCQCLAPTRQVMFFRHIGAIVVMFNRHIRGRLCRSCVNEQFAQTTLTTSFLGWWGMISFFLTPFFLLNNIIRYLFCLSLKPGPGQQTNGTGLAIFALIAAFIAPALVALLIFSVLNSK